MYRFVACQPVSKCQNTIKFASVIRVRTFALSMAHLTVSLLGAMPYNMPPQRSETESNQVARREE